MGFWAAIPAIASVAGSLFGKKKSGGETVPAQTLLPGYQQQAGEQLGDYIKKFMAQYTPGKEFPEGFDVFGQPTQEESAGMTRLNQFLAQPELNALLSGAEQNVVDTLGGKFLNPAESPFIRSMVNLSKMNLDDLINQSRARAGARGTYFTKEAQAEEGRLAERTQNFLDKTVGEFIESERGRQLQSVPLALAIDQYRNLDVPLKKIEASQTFGSLPRLLQQAQLEAEYQDFQRKQGELGKVVGTAQDLFGTNTPYIPSYTTPIVQGNNTLGNILGMISKLNLNAMSGTGSIWDKIGSVFGG